MAVLRRCRTSIAPRFREQSRVGPPGFLSSSGSSRPPLLSLSHDQARRPGCYAKSPARYAELKGPDIGDDGELLLIAFGAVSPGDPGQRRPARPSHGSAAAAPGRAAAAACRAPSRPERPVERRSAGDPVPAAAAPAAVAITSIASARRGLLEPGEVGPDRAEVGARAMPGQRRAPEVTGVPGEQLRVLRSQSGVLRDRAGCVLGSHAGPLLLRMAVLRDCKHPPRPHRRLTPAQPRDRRRRGSCEGDGSPGPSPPRGPGKRGPRHHRRGLAPFAAGMITAPTNEKAATADAYLTVLSHGEIAGQLPLDQAPAGGESSTSSRRPVLCPWP